MKSQPNNGGVMRAWVAYVTYEPSGLGSQILGVRTDQEAGKKLAYSHWEHNTVEDVAPKLKWTEFEGNDGKGLQAITPTGVYYLEEVDFEVVQPGDVKETQIGYLDLQVLRLTIENGRLAQIIVNNQGFYKALEERELVLEKRIDELIQRWVKDPNDPGVEVTEYTFEDGEIWRVGDHGKSTTAAK